MEDVEVHRIVHGHTITLQTIHAKKKVFPASQNVQTVSVLQSKKHVSSKDFYRKGDGHERKADGKF